MCRIDTLPFSPGHNQPLLPCVCAHKKHAPTIHFSSPLKAWKVTVVSTDATMPPFNVISISSTPEIVLSSQINSKLQESEDERRAKLDGKINGK